MTSTTSMALYTVTWHSFGRQVIGKSPDHAIERCRKELTKYFLQSGTEAMTPPVEHFSAVLA